jgi:hypothetical protein
MVWFRKSIWVRNTVTGEPFKVRYDTNGQSLILHVGRYANLPSETSNRVQSGTKACLRRTRFRTQSW